MCECGKRYSNLHSHTPLASGCHIRQHENLFSCFQHCRLSETCEINMTPSVLYRRHMTVTCVPSKIYQWNRNTFIINYHFIKCNKRKTKTWYDIRKGERTAKEGGRGIPSWCSQERENPADTLSRMSARLPQKHFKSGLRLCMNCDRPVETENWFSNFFSSLFLFKFQTYSV